MVTTGAVVSRIVATVAAEMRFSWLFKTSFEIPSSIAGKTFPVS
ncbi:hypothetical protein [Streptococcus suis]|nr:hypothetical protein [Streptococcus suis]